MVTYCWGYTDSFSCNLKVQAAHLPKHTFALDVDMVLHATVYFDLDKKVSLQIKILNTFRQIPKIYCEIKMDRDDGPKNEAITGNVNFLKNINS